MGVVVMPMAIMALRRLGPRKAASAMARIRKGIASMASVSRLMTASMTVVSTISASQPRIDEHVGDVGEEIEHDIDARRHQHDALHHGIVAVEHGIHDELAEAGNGEDLLGQHGAGQELAELERAE